MLQHSTTDHTPSHTCLGSVLTKMGAVIYCAIFTNTALCACLVCFFGREVFGEVLWQMFSDKMKEDYIQNKLCADQFCSVAASVSTWEYWEYGCVH